MPDPGRKIVARARYHHHFIDEIDGSIHDIPWEALEVRRVRDLEGFDVESYQVVARERCR